jgi:hypothetical protein
VCGRFKRKSDKQKGARVFEVQAGLEEADFAAATIFVRSPCNLSPDGLGFL